jgi:basic amino acid/polyamine antiporter, APA family
MFKRKPLHMLLAEADGSSHGLRRALGAVNLVSNGIGAMIGSGIFVLTGHAAAQHAGPAIVLSLLLSAVACACAGLCYAELASMIPVAGSAYTYAYATLGEVVAWIIGWDLILEYLFGASTVAVGWSGYVTDLFQDFGIALPAGLTAWINIPAMLVIAAITGLLVIGVRESAWFNNIIVCIKLIVVVLFLVFGISYVSGANWKPFIPANDGEGAFFSQCFSHIWDPGWFFESKRWDWVGHYGWSGILRGAGVIFFAYIGFDVVSTTAQEAKNPQRDMPVGILGSLAVCAVLYVLVAIVMTGLVRYDQLVGPAPFAVAINAAGEGLFWLRPFVKIGIIAGLTSVILVLLLGQPRIFYAMATDGLMPRAFAKIHPRFKTPYVPTLITGAVAMVVAGALPIDILGELVSIGTLLAFLIVCLGVLVLRYRHPDAPRNFRTPWVPVVPIAGAALALLQMIFLPADTWLRLLIWMAIGLVIYFAYSRWHSRVQLAARKDVTKTPGTP